MNNHRVRNLQLWIGKKSQRRGHHPLLKERQDSIEQEDTSEVSQRREKLSAQAVLLPTKTTELFLCKHNQPIIGIRIHSSNSKCHPTCKQLPKVFKILSCSLNSSPCSHSSRSSHSTLSSSLISTLWLLCTCQPMPIPPLLYHPPSTTLPTTCNNSILPSTIRTSINSTLHSRNLLPSFLLPQTLRSCSTWTSSLNPSSSSSSCASLTKKRSFSSTSPSRLRTSSSSNAMKSLLLEWTICSGRWRSSETSTRTHWKSDSIRWSISRTNAKDLELSYRKQGTTIRAMLVNSASGNRKRLSLGP